MKFEGQPQPNQPTPEDELKTAQKEMHMGGRAMRVNETPEEYKAEREKSWAEKQEPKVESPENEEVEQQVKGSLDTVSNSGIVKVYDRSGKFVFSGNPDQLMIFWKNKDYGTVEDIGGISDEDGKSIFRFGPADGRGFTDRKRVEGLFQQLEGKVASKKRGAEDAQKLVELREQLGIKQETPVAPRLEQATEQVEETVVERQERVEDGVENPMEQENLFDDEKAKQILDVTKDWIKYGGNFYSHLTGKDPRLEKGVDYKINPDGTPDMASYREARQKRAEAWFNDPGNKKWLEDFQKFHQQHSDNDLSFEKKIVSAKQPDGSFVDKERWTTPYLYENGWLYYETNYFDEQKGELKQPEREKTKNRVYFNVDGGNLMSTFGEVIDELNADPELQKLGFQIKTAEARIVGKTEVDKKKEVESMAMDIMNQKDRIVLYLGDKGIERALPILRKYAEKNLQKFGKEGILLAQTLTGESGQEIPGISVTSETKGMSPDPTESSKEYASFNDMQSKVIDSCFRSITAGLKNPKTLESMSMKYPVMKEALSKLPAGTSTENYMKAILSDPNGEEFLSKNLKAIYPQWSKAFGMSGKNIAFKEN